MHSTAVIPPSCAQVNDFQPLHCNPQPASPPPLVRADVLLEERMQAIQEHPVHKLSGGEVRTASCHSGGSGHDPAHLFAAAVSMGMPGW